MSPLPDVPQPSIVEKMEAYTGHNPAKGALISMMLITWVLGIAIAANTLMTDDNAAKKKGDYNEVPNQSSNQA